MESSAIARYIPQNSEKRVFSGGSSSCGEPEVIEIAPPVADQKAKRKDKGKQKEVAYQEIIDVDMEEDSNDVVLLGEKVESRKRTRGSMGISLGSSSATKVDSNKKGKEISGHPPKGFNPGSNNFFDLDDYVFDDDFWTLQSRFDSIGLPAGIEAPLPLFPDFVPMKKQNSATPFVTSNVQSGSSVPAQTVPSNFAQIQLAASGSKPNSWLSSSKQNTAVSGHSNSFDPKHVPAQTVPSNFAQIGSGSYLYNNFNTQAGNGPSHYPQLAMNTAYPLGLAAPTSHSQLHESIKGYINAGMSSGIGGIYSMNDSLLGQNTTFNGPSSKGSKGLSYLKIPSSKAKPMDVDVQKRYESFKKFDTVVDHSGHHYVHQNAAMNQPPKNWAKRIQDEWRILEKDLPDTIFVRAYESRMDLLRAVIIGAEGTPYHDGLFFFDVFFPSSYPNSPPLVHYHSGGLRINPNLYNCGKVCLSLLNTWSGGHKERWLPGTSTMLQVLVSIQGLILNMKPYFNEPGYAHSNGSLHGEKASLQYNENTLLLSLKTMVYTMNNPPKNFEDLVIGHFQYRLRDILMACKAYTEGVQVGCLVKGGVQDVDEGDNTCSSILKQGVGSYIKTLIAAFKKIGAKEAEDFLC